VYLLKFYTNPLPMFTKSNKKAKRPRVVPTLETKLKVIADSVAGEHGITTTTERTTVPKKNKNI